MHTTDTPDLPFEDEPAARPKAKKPGSTANPKRTTVGDAESPAKRRSLAAALKPDRPSIVAYATLGTVVALGLIEWPAALVGAGAWAAGRAIKAAGQ